MIGTTVGQYRILARIGEGGMGEVFRGEDTMLERQVAIKVLRPELAKQQNLVDRFRTEAVALARLNHPNIAAVFGLLQEKGRFLMVLEFIDGDTLEAIVARRGPLPWPEAMRVAKDTLAALEHAHAMGVVHRDLKPSNLMITRTGQLKVMDFGIARLAGTSRHTEFGRIVGTPLYMSPEQLRGEEVDGRSDLYSLGVVLYELVTGREAFQADSDYALLMAQLNQMPEPPSRYTPSLPAEVENAIVRSIQKSRQDRWTSANAFRRALAPLVPEPAEADEPVTVVEPAQPDPSRPPATRLATPPSVPATRIGHADAAVPNGGAGRASRLFGRLGPAARIRLAASAAAGLVLVTVVAQAVRTPAARTEPTHRDSAQPRPPQLAAVSPEPAPPPPRAAGSGGGVPAPLPPPPPPPPPSRGVEVAPPTRRDPPSRPGPRPTEARPVDPGPRVRPTETAEPVPPPPPSPVTTPSPNPTETAASEEPVDLTGADAALRAGLDQVAGWLAAKDVAQVKRSFTGDDATEKKLVALVEEFRLSVEKPTLVEKAAAGGRATAEYTAEIRWRSSFGNNRKVAVRLVTSYRRDGNDWRLVSWRFAGTPDLD